MCSYGSASCRVAEVADAAKKGPVSNSFLDVDKERNMANDQQQDRQDQQEAQGIGKPRADTTDGLANKKPEDLTPEELRLMADTMPGDGPGD